MPLPNRSRSPEQRSAVARLTPRSIFSYWRLTWRRLTAVFGPPLLVLIVGIVARQGTSKITESRADGRRSRAVTDAALQLVSSLTDAETGQRGFLLTGNEEYLRPYLRAVDSVPIGTRRLRAATDTGGVSATTKRDVDSLTHYSDLKMAEISESLRLRRTVGVGAALAHMNTDKGLDYMRAAHKFANGVRDQESVRLASRSAELTRYTNEVTLIVIFGTSAAFVIALMVNVLLARDAAVQTRLAAERDEAVDALIESNEETVSARDAESLSNALLRDSEAKLVLSMEAGGLGSWEWDIKRNVVHWSPQTERMHGLAEGTFSGSREEFVSYIHPDDRERVTGEIARTLAERRSTYYIKYRFLRTDGVVRWLEGFARMRVDENGEPASFLGVSHDVTQREELLEGDQQARRDAEAANAAKAIFLTTMSHELRTPLNAVSGYVDLLEMGVRGPVTDQQREDLRRIRRASQHLLSLINDILNYARLEAGSVELHFSEIALVDALSEMEALIAPQLRAKGVAYAYRPCARNVRVYADREKLDQILLNLVGNAVKFTDRDGRITLSCEVDGDNARVIVEDTGRGIPRGKLETIFDPFVQVDRHLTPERHQGVGLGLAISRDLARAMQGDISVQSDAGQGATFVLTLPRYVPDSPSVRRQGEVERV
jgi:PAS domain S-box-containing protein